MLMTLLMQGTENGEGGGVDTLDTAAEWTAKLQELSVEYAPRAIGALVALILGWMAVGILARLSRRALGRTKVDPTLATFLNNILRMALLTLVVLMALQTLGVQTASFVAILGAAGFAIGFALKDSLGNFASGVLIMIFRPFKAGDYVEAGGASGTVVEVGVFATVIKTPDNKKVIVANTSITEANITNYSAYPTRRVDMVFGISYGDDIDQARKVLQDVLAADERILKDPAPVIAVAALADSSVNLHCRPWVNTPDYWAVYWETTEEVKKRFDAAGVSIPFPQRDVHLHQVS
jgi:small conductance mechanosensitive channel